MVTEVAVASPVKSLLQQNREPGNVVVCNILISKKCFYNTENNLAILN